MTKAPPTRRQIFFRIALAVIAISYLVLHALPHNLRAAEAPVADTSISEVLS